MTIKNTCLVITTAFVFFAFFGTPDIIEGRYFFAAYCVCCGATMIYMIANNNLRLETIKNIEARKIVRRMLEIQDTKRWLIFFATVVIVVVAVVIKSVPYDAHVELAGNGYKLLDFDAISALLCGVACFWFSSPIFLSRDIYLLKKFTRKAAAEFAQEKTEEPFE